VAGGGMITKAIPTDLVSRWFVGVGYGDENDSK
jgi:hypothetical protein